MIWTLKNDFMNSSPSLRMKIKRVFNLLYATGSLLTCAITLCSAVNAQQKPCDGSDLPAPIQALLKDKFPSLRPKQLSDMSDDDQQLWKKVKGKSSDCPGIATGHFEIKDQLAYAILLVSKQEPNAGYKLVVFTKDANGDSYSAKLLNQVEGSVEQIDSSGLVISRAPPGKYSDALNSKSIQLNLDGILLEWTQGSADLFYFSGGKYLKLSVSE
jgi:hypothetical protein